MSLLSSLSSSSSDPVLLEFEFPELELSAGVIGLELLQATRPVVARLSAITVAEQFAG